MLLISKNYISSQKTLEDFGYKSMSFKFQNDKIDLIIISKIGEEKISKPLFFYCQESEPRPLIIYDEKGLYPILPFNETNFLDDYHIIIIAKPHIPLLANANELGNNSMFFKDKIKIIPPKGYTDRNYLDYYVFRNNFILKQLLKEKWVDKSKLVVAGHADGSAVATRMASLNPKITYLIFANGNPYGKIINILDNQNNGKEIIDYWKTVVENANTIHYNGVETYKAIYSFSQPQRAFLLSFKMPILITYCLKDTVSLYNILFQMEVIGTKKQNISFINYESLENNCLDMKGMTNDEIRNWDTIANDWLWWLNNNK